jgi:hypothetical protein
MPLTKEQCKEFEEKARPLMEWLSNNFNSNVAAIVYPTSAELADFIAGTGLILDYVKVRGAEDD